jgi:hypothetical protein
MAEPFVLPAGLQLSTADGVLTIRYPGDVVIDQDLGMDSLDIEADGDIEINLPRVTGTMRAGGTLSIVGEVDGGSLHGTQVVLGNADVVCSAIAASERIEVGPALLHVDVIIAPMIDIDPDAHGRVTVIESKNERGPTKIKGGFSLQEYEELIGNAEAFLAERGLQPLDGAAITKATAPSKGKAKKAPAAPLPPPVEVDEDMDDPLSLSTDELALEEVPEANVASADDIDEELQQALQDAVDRIVSCYASGELPPPVEELKVLVGARDYGVLRAKITLVWNGLLGYHQKRGIRPHHQVTHAFNVIHGLLQPA